MKCEKRGFLGLKLHASYGEALTLVEDDFYNQLCIRIHIKENLSLNGFIQRFIQQMADAVTYRGLGRLPPDEQLQLLCATVIALSATWPAGAVLLAPTEQMCLFKDVKSHCFIFIHQKEHPSARHQPKFRPQAGDGSKIYIVPGFRK
ncbi:hypothetical protein BX616_008400 [Lobosporangium transversale]|nr:hypothetical protein BX616_008400 [Lobosporangium transversale]